MNENRLDYVLEELIWRAKKKEVVTILSCDPHSGALWCVIGGLRGPDSGSGYLKRLTTARVRAILGISPLEGASTTSSPLTKEEVEVRDDLLESASLHFRIHFRSAINALRFLGYEVPQLEIETLGSVRGWRSTP